MQEPNFVGRENELAELWANLEEALAWKGRVCFVVGQAGSGKTALVRHFLEQALATEPTLVVATGTCNAQTGAADPYLPFRDALAMLTVQTLPAEERARETQPADRASAENSNRLRAVLVRSVQVLVEAAPYLVGALVPVGKIVGAVGKATAVQTGWMKHLDALAENEAEGGTTAAGILDQGRIFEQYARFLQELSKTMPLILFLDDLQWADSASLNLLFHLGRHIEKHPILILGAYRPDDVALGRNGERHPLEPVVNELTRYQGDVTVDLDAIPEEAGRQFVAALLDAEPHCLDGAFQRALYDHTEGHALFTVELLEHMKERGHLVRNGDGCWSPVPALDWSVLPARVEGVIEERIARLNADLRDLLTVGSIEGEEFEAEVVARVRDLTDLEALRQLSGDLERRYRLVSAQGMAQYGTVRLSLYRFWHGLFQQYLYDSLDPVERAYLHQDVGEVLEHLFDGQAAEIAGRLARHFEEAGLASQAVGYRLQAGKRAHGLSAHDEAATHFTRGLQLLVGMPAGVERLKFELELQTMLGTTRIATHGYASPHVARAFGRAREICQELGDPPQVIPVLYGLCLYRLVRAELRTAYEEGQRLLALAQQAEDAAYVLGCQVQLGVSALYLGQFSEARSRLEEAGVLYEPNKHAHLAYRHGQDPGVTALCYLSWVLWAQGHPDQARSSAEAAVALAEQVRHPYSLAMARAFLAKLYELRREWAACQAQAEAALELAEQGRFALWQAMARMVRGTAVTFQGRPDEGISDLTTGLTELAATGSRLAAPYFQARLAEAYVLTGQRSKGLEAIDESLRSEEQAWWLPEQYRIRAELLRLAPNGDPEAEASLRQALATARSQGSRMLELRAATGLVRLLQKGQPADEAREQLTACFVAFTEGLDTADLREARELLQARGAMNGEDRLERER